jgi:small-conductance mechanosensitive channel
MSRVAIPPRYLAKLAVELILLAGVVVLYGMGHLLFADTPRLQTILLVSLRFVIFLFGASLLVRLLAMIYRSRKHLPYHKKDNVTIGLSNLFILFIGIYGVISVFGLFGVSISTMFTTLSIVAAALAILSKDFFADIISGMVISFSREISIEDYVKVGEHKGKIIDINITKTALLNEDDDIIFLPNSTVFSSDIINYTKKQIKKTTIEFEVPTGAFPSVDQLEEQLRAAMDEFHHLIEPNSYSLRVVNIKKDLITYKFQYSLVQFNRDLERQVKRKAVRHLIRILHSVKPVR